MIDGFSNHAIDRFNGIGGVNDFPDLVRVIEEGDQVGPVVAPGAADGGVLAVPLRGKGFQFLFCFSHGDGLVDFPEPGGDGFAVFPGYESQGIAHHVHDTELDLCAWESGGDRFRKTG